MYPIIKPIFFLFNPENIHHFVMNNLKFIHKNIPFGRNILEKSFGIEDANLKRKVFGIDFKNPVGLAAGFDKNGEYIEALSSLGFGFIEVGTVTPLAQPGNDKPRMFRLKEDEALINRMGFNNKGVDFLVLELQKLRAKNVSIVIGGNIGKNKNTPNEDAVNDYIICFEKLNPLVDYFVVNVSSPNTPGLRDLQEKEPLKKILNTLQEINQKKEVQKPILLKIAPDLTDEQLDDVIEIVMETKIAGVIATNTTINKNDLKSDAKLCSEAGGLSGKPLRKRSTEVIRYLHQKSNAAFPIIGVGGINSAEDAKEKIAAGASLIQLYTGFIYQGPSIIRRICKAIR
ncbi:MAG: quinone-dependent dihydroorotate dehydrogenase [Sphingobacteriaceae bacterium]|nr:quinone-dependent dihydroorotate dehydrogenase [Sphingobacteriaceae bacterium]